MKTYCVLLLMMMSGIGKGQEVIDTKPHKIVMQFSTADSVDQQAAINQVRNIRTAWPNAKIEVVCHGPGLDLLMTTKSKMSKPVSELTSQGVVFAACNNTMRRRNLKKEDLLTSAVIVPSAMLELVTKQEEGWSYLKAAH